MRYNVVLQVLCGTETLLLFAKNQEEGEAWTTATVQAISEVRMLTLLLSFAY